jgi:hypothetical protein
MSERAPNQETAPASNSVKIFSHAGQQMSLLGDSFEVLPVMPKKGTQPDKLLRLLADGARLTHLEILGATGSWRGAAAAHELALRGWQFETRLIPAPTIACPSRVIAEYGLCPHHAKLARGEV